MGQEHLREAALDGATGEAAESVAPSSVSVVNPGSAVDCAEVGAVMGGAAADPTARREAHDWPGWARTQLGQAIDLVAAAPQSVNTAVLLYRTWFNPPLDAPILLRRRRPIAGVCRAAHAANRMRTIRDGVPVLNRHDVVGADGWWRTWGSCWTPPRRRRNSVRILLSPDPARLGELVEAVTGALLDSDVAWSLSCATTSARARRAGAAIIALPGLNALPDGLLGALEPILQPVAPPLCLPLTPGAALAAYPDNGMTFGEHRCHLIASALRHHGPQDNPFDVIGRAFVAHGIDPAAPHR